MSPPLPTQRGPIVNHSLICEGISGPVDRCNHPGELLAELTNRGLVLEPQKYRTYELHPFIAEYPDDHAMQEAFSNTLARIDAGDLPDIAASEYDVQPPKKVAAPTLQRVS